ncbi:MAG: hypothetical protein WCT08_02760 [Patescibacteria group bacterium]|jgi:hypothetical protein
MIPKVELIYSYEYAERLFRGGLQEFEEAWASLIKNGAIFEVIFDQAIDPILKNLPKVTGYEWVWEKSFLPVYLIAEGQAFPEPLSLVASDNPEQMLYELIRMLTRINIKTGFANDQLRDQTIQNVMKEVLKLAIINIYDAVADADLNLREKYGEDFQVSTLDLAKHPLKYYLDKK